MNVAFYCFKCIRASGCTCMILTPSMVILDQSVSKMYMHALGPLYGYFGPISIKNHGMSELTNQNAEQ